MSRREESIDDSIKLWDTFHQKKHRKLIKVALKWPKKWGRLGEAKTTYYASDKWHKDGNFTNYFHDHAAGVVCYHPLGSQRDLLRESPSVERWPDTGAVLGRFLGWDIDSDGKLLESEPDASSSLLCAFPDGHALFVVERGRITGLLVGPSLRVEAEGIDG